jgi:hypothetical protein
MQIATMVNSKSIQQHPLAKTPTRDLYLKEDAYTSSHHSYLDNIYNIVALVHPSRIKMREVKCNWKKIIHEKLSLGEPRSAIVKCYR